MVEKGEPDTPCNKKRHLKSLSYIAEFTFLFDENNWSETCEKMQINDKGVAFAQYAYDKAKLDMPVAIEIYKCCRTIAHKGPGWM